MSLDADEPDPDLEGWPRSCLRCPRKPTTLAELCPHCGEPTFAMGYCPICEDRWPLPIGTPCPKHEVDLGPPPVRSGPLGKPGESTKLVTLGRFANPGRVEALRIRLEAEGITTFLQGERMGSMSMYQVATGGMTLQVPEALAPEARIIQSQTWADPIEDDELDDAWEELGPEPGAEGVEVLRGLALLALGITSVAILLALAFGSSP